MLAAGRVVINWTCMMRSSHQAEWGSGQASPAEAQAWINGSMPKSLCLEAASAAQKLDNGLAAAQESNSCRSMASEQQKPCLAECSKAGVLSTPAEECTGCCSVAGI